jgi:predicted O-methyltransferase YrrM
MIKFGQDEGVKIDQAHADLITGLIKSHKPKTVLELGIGGGQSTNAMLAGLDYNQQTFDYTLVDNWMDFGGVMPDEVKDLYEKRITIVTSNEKDFVFGANKKYDFIMSDADHHQTDQWFEYVFDTLLADNGILCYHDVNLIENEFVNLRNIYYRCQEFNLKHFLFNKNSLPSERCQRGLLVIFK